MRRYVSNSLAVVRFPLEAEIVWVRTWVATKAHGNNITMPEGVTQSV